MGNNTDAKQTLAIQVRIFIPTKGVFKGMLMRSRDNGEEPIRLNESLRKVMPSRSNDASDNGYLVVKNKFPSTDNWEGVGRLFNAPLLPNRSMTASFRKRVKKANLVISLICTSK